jgi:hypothetical protein
MGNGAGTMREVVVRRRFGPGQERPCFNPDVMLCAKAECCAAGVCQWKDDEGKEVQEEVSR